MTRFLSFQLFFFAILGQLSSQEEVTKDPYIQLSKKFIGAVKRNEMHKNAVYFDSSVYGRMAEANTTKAIEAFLKEKGPIVAIEKTEVDTQGCKMATATAIKTQKGKFLWYQFYDQARYLQRFHIDTFSQQSFYRPRPLTAPGFSRKDISIETNAFIRLPGYLYLPPVKKAPLVILVHGSGPHDRHCSIDRNKIFLDIAHALVQKGIGVLVYDKRTYVYQFRDPFPADSMDYYSETVDDAVAAFRLSKTLGGVDTSRIFIAGHSLGALCGPLIARQCSGLKGLLLLAGPARSLLEVIPEQLDYVMAFQTTNKEEAEKMSNAIKWQVKNAMKPDLNLKSKVMLPFGGKPKYWLMDRNYKVLEEASGLQLPILLIQGGRDYNVTKKDYDLWLDAMKGKPNFRAVWLEDLDHLFFEGTGKAKPQDYSDPNHVSAKLTDEIIKFVNQK